MFAGHAYLVAGRSEDIGAVFEVLKKEGIETEKNPDLYVSRFGQFAIDDARKLTERAALRAIGTRRVFVIALDSINAEAQNALLKTLEEPPGGALFFILHPAPDTLLPTIRSRVQMLALPSRAAHAPLIDVTSFLKAAPAKRLDMLKPLLEKDQAEHRDFGEILAFLSALEKELAQRVKEGKGEEGGLHAVYRARRYIGDRGALVKPLLEQVALLV